MKTKTILIILVVIITALAVQAQTTGALTDTRDGKTYKTIVIGTQTWMAENLNYKSDNSWSYGDSPTNSNAFGRLYNWEAAIKVCPSGWHLPSKTEFDVLLAAVGGSGNNAYFALKEGGSSGFSGVLGGYRSNKGEFGNIGQFGHWWASTVFRKRTGWSLGIMPPLQFSHMRNTYRDWAFSVRCIKD